MTDPATVTAPDVVFGDDESDSMPKMGRSFHAIYVESGQLRIKYTGELEARKAIAKWARALGWLVREEVVIPGWGRIDLVLRDRPTSPAKLIELKQSLCKAAEIRRAFQQADGYGRWWAKNTGEACDTTVIGLQVDADAVAAVHETYPEVGYGSASYLLKRLEAWGDFPGARIERAHRRAAQLRQLLAVHEHALELIDPSWQNQPTPPGGSIIAIPAEVEAA